MTKCDFCEHSFSKDGRMSCPHDKCQIGRYAIEELLEKATTITIKVEKEIKCVDSVKMKM